MSDLAKTTTRTDPRAAENWVSDLAFEVALEYFPPQQLQLRYDLSADQYEQITHTTKFQKLVLAHRRDIDENGTQFKVLARKLATINLPKLHEIIQDPTASHSDRISAHTALARFGGLDKSESADRGNTAFALQINFSNDDTRTVTIEGASSDE